jgi:hypothetical protein
MFGPGVSTIPTATAQTPSADPRVIMAECCQSTPNVSREILYDFAPGWMSTGHPITMDQFSAGYGDRYRNSYEKLVFGIETLADGRLIGLVVLSTQWC